MAEETTKSSKYKLIGVIIVALLGTYGTVMSTMIQATSAKESSVKAIVNQLNDVVIPGLQKVIDRQLDSLDELSERNSVLRERVASLEAKFDMKLEEMFFVGPRTTGWANLEAIAKKPTGIKPSVKVKKKKSAKVRAKRRHIIPTIQMQRVLDE